MGCDNTIPFFLVNKILEFFWTNHKSEIYVKQDAKLNTDLLWHHPHCKFQQISQNLIPHTVSLTCDLLWANHRLVPTPWVSCDGVGVMEGLCWHSWYGRGCAETHGVVINSLWKWRGYDSTVSCGIRCVLNTSYFLLFRYSFCTLIQYFSNTVFYNIQTV